MNVPGIVLAGRLTWMMLHIPTGGINRQNPVHEPSTVFAG